MRITTQHPTDEPVIQQPLARGQQPLALGRQPLARGQLPARDLAPSLDDIIAFFGSVQTKGELLGGLLNFARPYFQSMAVFAVGARDLALLAGHGPNIRLPKIMGLPIPVDGVTVVRRCIVNKIRYQGPVPAGEEEKAVFRHFVREIPDECWLYPGQVGETVDCLFYAERPLGLRVLCIERLEFIIAKATLAMRLLYLRKQLARKG